MHSLLPCKRLVALFKHPLNTSLDWVVENVRESGNHGESKTHRPPSPDADILVILKSEPRIADDLQYNKYQIISYGHRGSIHYEW